MVDNVKRIVEEAGATMDQVVDVTTFLVDMKRDFSGYNEVWAQTLARSVPPGPPWPLMPYQHPLRWR